MKKVIVSLCDGMSCGQIAICELGLNSEDYVYYSSEIDKYPIQVTQANFPNTIQIGDIIKVSYKNGILSTEKGNYDIGQVHLLMSGTPCQGFSLAGSGLNFEDSRSKLFFDFVRILGEMRPTYFLLENVVPKNIEWANTISDLLGVDYELINSSLVSAQFRERLYWTNISSIKNKLQDKKLVLQDILDDIEFTHNIKNVELSKSYNGIENIKKGTSGYSWFYEQQTYTKNSKTRTLKAGGGSGNIPKILNDDLNKFRKLSTQECEKLQTVPIGYTKAVSNNQAYKMIGNGWTIKIIKEYLKQIFSLNNH